MRMLYLISGRSATSWNIGRKIPDVTTCFRKSIAVDLLCGGDLYGGKGYNNEARVMQSDASYHAKWYRRNPITNFFVHSISEIKDLIHTKQTYKTICRDNNSYALIWERSSRLHWAGLLYAKKNKIPCVLEWKDNLINYRFSLFRPLALYVERWKNNNADYIAVESKVLKETLEARGVPEAKIFVTYNAVNPQEFVRNEVQREQIRLKLGISDSEIIVGYLGSYAFYHDSIRMIKAAEELKSRGFSRVKWLMIGDGKDRKVCEDEAKDKGLLGKEIIMLDKIPKEEVPKYLSAIDITILPGSTDIICPIKVMEYMAMESVVLVPDYACNREVIDGKNGLLFEPFNEISMANEIVKMVENKEKCKEMGALARKTVVERFTWDKTYGKVLQRILNLINGH